jgi:ABC-type multidrug transport system ATPase subunit
MPSTLTRPEPSTQGANLVATDLEVRRGGVAILDRVSFSLAPGEIAVLVGPNGAGKTTLIEALIGALKPSGGRVSFGGRELRDLPARSAVFSYLPDAAEPAPELTVAALMRHALRFGHARADRAEQLAARLNLPALASARAGTLSRGEKRRVLLFAALCSDRPVVVLDEPLGTFDPFFAREVIELLREQARLGAALLLSVHQLSDAEKLDGRVLILDGGRLVASGTLPELRERAGLAQGSLEQVFLSLVERDHAWP